MRLQMLAHLRWDVLVGGNYSLRTARIDATRCAAVGKCYIKIESSTYAFCVAAVSAEHNMKKIEVAWLGCAFGDPAQIVLATGGHFQHHTFWQIIGMQLFHGIANTLKKFGLGLDHEKPFLRRLYFALPAVNRFDLRHNVDARRQPALNQTVSNLAGFFLRSGSRKNYSRGCHCCLLQSVSIGDSGAHCCTGRVNIVRIGLKPFSAGLQLTGVLL
jgi:hypothetical protein